MVRRRMNGSEFCRNRMLTVYKDPTEEREPECTARLLEYLGDIGDGCEWWMVELEDFNETARAILKPSVRKGAR